MCFYPLSLFQWYPQSKKFLLNISIKCWNSAFNAQGSRVIIVVVYVGAVNIYVTVVEALRKKERGDENQFPTKIGVKTSLGPNYFISQNFISSYTFDALLSQNWLFSLPNHLTLQVTLMCAFTFWLDIYFESLWMLCIKSILWTLVIF